MANIEVKFGADEQFYVKIGYQSKKKQRLLLQKNGKQEAFNVDGGEEMTQPASRGNGRYQFNICEQISGTNYSIKGTAYANVNMKDPDIYMLKANDYVPFSEESSFYETAKSLGSWENVWKYCLKNFSYDYIGQILRPKKEFKPPDQEDAFKRHKGSCYEQSGIVAAFARINGVKAAMVIGKLNGQSHAWVEVDGKVYDQAKLKTSMKNNSATYREERRF